MPNKIDIVNLEDVKGSVEDDGLLLVRRLITSAQGAARLEMMHIVIQEGMERKGAGTEGEQEEAVFVIQGEAEITLDGKTERVRAGSSFLVPPKVALNFKVVKGPFEMIAALSPQSEE